MGIEFFLGLGGVFLWQYPSDPDKNFSTSRVAGVALLFLFFCFNIFHWGKIISRLLGLQSLEPLSSWAFGTVWATLVFALLGHLGVLGPGLDFIPITLLALGPILSLGLTEEKKSNIFEEKWPFWICFTFLLAALGIRFLISTLPHGTTDPFMYHLYAPRFWWASGKIGLPLALPISMQSTYWEYLLGWGPILFGEKPSHGLFEGQIFGQLAHSFLALGGCMLALFFIGKKLQLSNLCCLILAWVGVLSAEFMLIGCIAKNDLGAIFWGLSAVAFYISDCGIGLNKKMIFTGGLAGAAIAAKFNSVLFLGPLFLLFFLVQWKKQEKFPIYPFFIFGFSAVVAMAPIVIRNVVLVNSFFFPINFPLHSPWITPSHLAESLRMNGYWVSFGDFIAGILRCFKDNFFSLLIILVPIVVLKRKPYRFSLLVQLAIVCLANYFFFASRFDSHSFLRWLGAPLLLLPALGVAALFSFNPIKKLETPLLLSLMGVLVIMQLYLERIQIWGVVHRNPFNLVIRDDDSHSGGSAKAWLRMHASLDDLILSLADNQIYYLSDYRVRVLGDDPELARKTQDINNPAQLLKVIKSTGARYLLDTKHWSGVQYWGREAALLGPMISHNPLAIVFQGKLSRVVDLNLLNEAE